MTERVECMMGDTHMRPSWTKMTIRQPQLLLIGSTAILTRRANIVPMPAGQPLTRPLSVPKQKPIPTEQSVPSAFF
jgi:hypothetical protein